MTMMPAEKLPATVFRHVIVPLLKTLRISYKDGCRQHGRCDLA
jgi:hypothetical protein